MGKFVKCGAFWKNEKGTGYSGKIEKDKQPDIYIGYYTKDDKSDEPNF